MSHPSDLTHFDHQWAFPLLLVGLSFDYVPKFRENVLYMQVWVPRLADTYERCTKMHKFMGSKVSWLITLCTCCYMYGYLPTKFGNKHYHLNKYNCTF